MQASNRGTMGLGKFIGQGGTNPGERRALLNSWPRAPTRQLMVAVVNGRTRACQRVDQCLMPRFLPTGRYGGDDPDSEIVGRR